MKTRAKVCAVLLLCAGVLTVTLAAVGCSSKKRKDKSSGDTAQQSAAPSEEPTVEKSRGTVNRSTKPAPKGLFPVEGMTDISDNPGYFTAKEIQPTADAVQMQKISRT